MWAALNWSFEGLSENEQMLLTKLAVFRSTFSIEGAQAVASCQTETAIELLSNLVAKSLVVVDQSATAVHYRLLETTRAFAEEKLRGSADAATVWRQHAEYLLQLFSRGAASEVEPPKQRLRVYRQRVDDVRNALEWSFSASGDPRIGVKMIIDSAPMWLRLSLLSEYTAIVENAADRLAEDPDLNHRELMWLYAQLHTVHFHAVGISPKKERMLQTALDLAKSEGDYSCQLFCLWALFGTRLTQARYQTALDYALQFAAIAPQVPDPMQLAMGHRIVALGQWRSGDLKAANVHGEAALRATDETGSSPINLTLIYKHGVTSRGNLSNLQWLLGHPEQALQMASEAVDAGLASEDFAGLSYSLAQTIVPLAFWVGDYELAGERTSQLLDLARANDFGFWLFWGRSYECARRRLQERKRDAERFHRGECRSAVRRPSSYPRDDPRRHRRGFDRRGGRVRTAALVPCRTSAARGGALPTHGRKARGGTSPRSFASRGTRSGCAGVGAQIGYNIGGAPVDGGPRNRGRRDLATSVRAIHRRVRDAGFAEGGGPSRPD